MGGPLANNVLYTVMIIKYFFPHSLHHLNNIYNLIRYNQLFSELFHLDVRWVSVFLFIAALIIAVKSSTTTKVGSFSELFPTLRNKHSKMLTYANWSAPIFICPQRITGAHYLNKQGPLSRNITLIKTTNMNTSIWGHGSFKCHTWS